MEEENKNIKCSCNAKCNCNAAGGGIYGLAFVGALVYYMQHAHNFGEVVIGFLKALVWPAIIAYKLLELLLK